MNGQPLYYTTMSQVTLRRPDKLRVITPGDGPPTEFYYDGKTMMAYDPAVNLVAVAEAPPTIDAMAKSAYDQAAIYFPWIDFVVADPYKDIAGSLRSAFVVGQSDVVGGTVTDMVAIATDAVQAEIWISASDHLPRMIRAVFPKEPGNKRYETDFSNWGLGAAVDANTSPRRPRRERRTSSSCARTPSRRRSREQGDLGQGQAWLRAALTKGDAIREQPVRVASRWHHARRRFECGHVSGLLTQEAFPLAQMGSANDIQTRLRLSSATGINGLCRSSVRR